ncbi:cell division protein ZapA [Porphyromonas pogonae]|uniref:cell division protein ZapA n=1 Tax=Porphyromonas pogonae TaxID=867595 RepID=UPI002E78BF6F|nr:cell division protein ZapA [Porphyromonas pogonae]
MLKPESENNIQRINLVIDSNHLTMLIPRDEEPLFRRAGSFISGRLEGYRHKYPNESTIPANGYLMMTAVDAAYHYHRLKAEKNQEALHRKVEELNESIEDFLLRYHR